MNVELVSTTPYVVACPVCGDVHQTKGEMVSCVRGEILCAICGNAAGSPIHIPGFYYDRSYHRFQPAGEYIRVTERWTRTSGERKIGDGPWEPIELYGGRVPYVFADFGSPLTVPWDLPAPEPSKEEV